MKDDSPGARPPRYTRDLPPAIGRAITQIARAIQWVPTVKM